MINKDVVHELVRIDYNLKINVWKFTVKYFFFLGVKSECLPMCQYNASLSEIRPLTALCTEDMGRITKCASGIFEK